MVRRISGYGPSLVVLITAVLVLVFGPAAVRELTFQQTRTRIIQARLNLEDNSLLGQLNQAYRDIATAVEPSVVHISAQSIVRDPLGTQRTNISAGSGWIYDDQGHVVTNHHVVTGANRIVVQLYDGTIREAQHVGSDETTDIAVLKIAPGRLHAATRADPSESVNQGDLVFAFGSPFDFRFSMSSGVVSGKGRTVNVIRNVAGPQIGYENFIQVDAAINPGNSGGPLTNHRGEVIGMNTAIATGRAQSTLEEGQFGGIGLAIPVEMIEPAVSQLIHRGFVEKGFLGVDIDTNFKLATVQPLGFIGYGVRIQRVFNDGPAHEAGVLSGDIVTHVNGNRVISHTQLQSVISSILPGEVARLSIWRYDPDNNASRTLDLDVTLARLDTLRLSGQIGPNQSSESLVALGIARMSTNSSQRAQRGGATDQPGVLIEEVVPDSQLGRSVSSGSVIVAVMDQPVQSVKDFLDELRRYDLRYGVWATVVGPDDRSRKVSLSIQ